jgi:RNA polymerase sporulation-specific sigma factor
MSKQYDGVSDEELIDRLRQGENGITDHLLDKYKNLVRSNAQTMYILGADNDDLIQEGMIGLFKAIRDYDSGRDASFFTFADLCISRQMYNAVQASQRQKHIPLNTYISLYAQVDKDSEEGQELGEMISSPTEPSLEEMVIGKETAKALEDQIAQELSEFENQVLDLHLTGMTYVQIAKVLGRDEKSTDNALQRVKTKVKKLIKK